jgi:hypothetical protein
MPSIEVDVDVYKFLESKVQGFGDTPNAVLRRFLGISAITTKNPSPLSSPSRAPLKTQRGKAPKTNLRDLVRVGSLKEGQALFLHDYQGNKIDGVQALIRGNDLEYKGRTYSMSALTRDFMKSKGYDSESYRGPQFWFTAQGRSVKDLWDEYLRVLGK